MMKINIISLETFVINQSYNFQNEMPNILFWMTGNGAH
ncbi:hypothetical protein LAC1533_2073 [Ligilactobacillus acidipiscis]|uniref:Uncharacterized protein n=1 Tax=Ligilactobacillus acidipiscis TaxID=89059 RepID=A0A1K1KVH9_9LACO|nr:hypothetical protein LAC1533_2073 [Ligilactobacillus acidipiscis]